MKVDIAEVAIFALIILSVVVIFGTVALTKIFGC